MSRYLEIILQLPVRPEVGSEGRGLGSGGVSPCPHSVIGNRGVIEN